MRLYQLSYLCFVVVAFFAMTSSAAPPGHAKQAVYETKIFTDGDLLFVDVHQNKRIYRFVVDTGASHTVVDSTTFKDLLLAEAATVTKETANGGVRVLKFRNPKDFLVGGKLPIRSSHLGCINLATISAMHGARIDGVLGCDFLGDYVVQFDFDRERLVIGSEIPKSAAASFRFTRSQLGCPIVTAGVSNSSNDDRKPREYVVDTGSAGPQEISLNHDRFQESINDGTLMYADRIAAVDISGNYRPRKGEIRGFAMWLDTPAQLRVSENRTDSQNLLALQFLLRFQLTIDFPKSTIYVEPRKSWVPVDWKDKCGLELIRPNREVLVAEVRQQSPAARNDLRKGDVIVSIDSVAASKLRLVPLRRKFCEEGKSIQLLIQRGSKQWVSDLTLTDYRKPVTKADFE